MPVTYTKLTVGTNKSEYEASAYALVFGYGDLVPVGMTNREDRKQNVLGFVDTEPGDIGRLVMVKKDEMKFVPIFLIFDKVESIDVVVERLIEIKGSLTETDSVDATQTT